MNLKDVKKGDIFYELDYKYWIKVTALEDCRTQIWKDGDKEREQYFCKVISDNGLEGEMLTTQGLEHYGPDLYSEEEKLKYGC